MKEIFERAKKMILSPKETWQAVKGEATTIQGLFINYAAPLALIPTVATLIGLSIVGIRMPAGHIARAPFTEALTASVVSYVFHLLGLLAGAWVVNLLAPHFNSKPDMNAAVKLVVYSMSPVWLLGIFSLVPGFGILQVFGLYGIYLVFLGLPTLMETPIERTLWYTVIIVISAMLISLIMTILVGGAFYGPMFLRMMAA
jgi:hypothetical protein